MAKEIDEYLMKKFCNGVVTKYESSRSKIPLPSQYFLSDKSLYEHFKEIKGLLEGILRGSSVPEDVLIRENLYCLNDLWTESQTVSKIDLRTRKNIWQKLTSIKDELTTKKGLKKDSGSSSGRASNATTQQQPDGEASSSRVKLGVPGQSALSFDASKVHGFADDVTALEKQVLVRQGSEDRFKAIGIIGKAGIGKTALCQLLFNTEEVKDYFVPRIWVCMSRQHGDDRDQKVEILKRMLVNLGVEEEIINKYKFCDELLYALHLQLQGKRYLIVLDDAREREIDKWYGELSSSSTHDGNWDALAHGLPKGCGGAVIVTSRNEKLAKTMTDPKGILHSVLPLSNPECSWFIFNEAARLDGKLDSDASINREILKEQILRKCAGLPLTAKMMGEYKNLLD